MVDTEIKYSDQVIVALRRIMRAIDLHSRRLVQDYSLTGPQLLLLQSIMKNRETSLGELAKTASLSNATVTGIIDRLERRGLVERRRGSRDRRQVFVRGTESARKILENAPPLLQEKFLAEFSNLDESEKTQILNSLNRIALMMGADKLDASPFLSSHPLEASEITVIDEQNDPDEGNGSAKEGN
ncbi:MAG TPA: MarR family transcriptional regulator [candidate division Zixibacteria bacterium]|nr:MarR family transcriptional regulator [candidate division Zixibacteria bacterium]